MLLIDEHPQQQKHLWAATWDSSIRRWAIPPDFQPFLDYEPRVPKSNFTIPGKLNIFFLSIIFLSDYQSIAEMKEEGKSTFPFTGAPSIRKYAVLNDRRQIVTKDGDGNLELWDVLQAKKLKNLPQGTNIEDVLKESVRKLWIPSWFSVETKCGVHKFI
jgi:hypothetical protein